MIKIYLIKITFSDCEGEYVCLTLFQSGCQLLGFDQEEVLNDLLAIIYEENNILGKHWNGWFGLILGIIQNKTENLNRAIRNTEIGVLIWIYPKCSLSVLPIYLYTIDGFMNLEEPLSYWFL